MSQKWDLNPSVCPRLQELSTSRRGDAQAWSAWDWGISQKEGRSISNPRQPPGKQDQLVILGSQGLLVP